MAIAERINSDNLNIHQFQETPEGRPELPFDVERDIDPEIKNNMLKELSLLATPSRIDKFVACAADIKLLWPEQDIPNLPSDLLLAGYDVQTFNNRPDYAASLKMLRPDLFPNIKWNDIEANYRDQIGLGGKMIIAALAKRIDPNRRILSKEHFDAAASSTGVNNIRKPNNWRHFVSATASMRLLDPNYNPSLNQGDWQSMKAELEKYESIDRWDIYGEIASGMKILAANRVEVTAPGVIEFQMYPPDMNTANPPPVPETRKF